MSEVKQSFFMYAAFSLDDPETLSKGTQHRFEIRDGFSICVKVSDSGNSITTSIDKKNEDSSDIKTIASISRCLYIENNVFEIDDDFSIISQPKDEDIEKFSGIKSYIQKAYMEKALRQLRLMSELSVINNKSKFVWLNTADGFSNSWAYGDCGFISIDDFLMSLPKDDPRKDLHTYKLIEFKCHNDHDFEFFNQMRLR